MTQVGETVKRGFDVVVAMLGLILVSPLVIGIMLVVYLRLGRPILFVQERPGLHGRLFRLYKFRTMTNDRGTNGKFRPDEERLTVTGGWLRRLSLDELPQLINILKGDMSSVGPRPLLVEYLPLYSSDQARRHEVRPGLTGWAQVNGRNELGWPDRLRLDTWYIDNRSLWLDLRILLMTVSRVFQGKGISEVGSATMSKFAGNDHQSGGTV